MVGLWQVYMHMLFSCMSLFSPRFTITKKENILFELLKRSVFFSRFFWGEGEVGEKKRLESECVFEKERNSNLRLFRKRGGGFPNFHHLKDLFSWNPRLRKAPPKKRKELLLFEVEGSQAQPQPHVT